MYTVRQLADLGYAPVVGPLRNGCHNVKSKRLHQELRAAGLSQRSGDQKKYVPPQFLRGSQDQRQALLEGLMDTDGTVSKRGNCCFDNTNQSLVEVVQELVVSLGGKGSIITKQPKITGCPDAVCALCWRFIFTPNFLVFRLPRKVARQAATVRRETQKWHYICDVVAKPREHMKCITVDSPSHLYLAGKSMIPTHNTLQAISAVRLRREAGHDGNCTPVFTTAISRGDWKRELLKWYPEANVHIVSMDDTKSRKKDESLGQLHQRRLDLWLPHLRGERGHSFLIAAYQSAPIVLEQSIKHDVIFDSCVLDESHNIKRASTETAKTVRPMVSRSRVALQLTGTPIHNRPYDLYNLLETCRVGYCGSLYKWAERYFMVRVAKGGWGSTIDEFQGPEAKARLIADTREMMLSRSVAEAYGELPAVQWTLRRIEAPVSYRISPAKVARLKDGGKLDEALRDCASRKLQYAAELVDDLREPVVLYCYKKEHVAELASKLRKLNIGCTVAMGAGEEGGSTPKKRDALIESWKRAGPETLALVCTMDAVKESATLIRAAVMVFCDFDWLPGKMLQCAGRIDPARQPVEQRRPVSIYLLATVGGPDEVVAETLVEKIREAEGIGAASGEQLLSAALKPLDSREVVVQSPEEVMASIVSKMEARAERLARVGMWEDDA